jgi:hypothetical protein
MGHSAGSLEPSNGGRKVEMLADVKYRNIGSRARPGGAHLQSQHSEGRSRRIKTFKPSWATEWDPASNNKKKKEEENIDWAELMGEVCLK